MAATTKEKEAFAKRFRIVRDRFDMSQEKFAEYLGCSKNTVSRYENGNTMPDIYTLFHIVNVCQIDITELVPEAYLRRKQELIRKIEDLETEIKADIEEVKTQNELRKTAIHMTSIAGKYDGEQKLSRGMVEAFIKNVYVYDKEHIEITYLFEDEIKKLLGQVQEQEVI